MSEAIASIIVIATIVVVTFAMLKEIRNPHKVADRARKRARQAAKQVEANKESYRLEKERFARLHCRHCNTSGYCTVDTTRVKQGISGGKATAAILTGGFSLLLTGLAKKNEVQIVSCSHCHMSSTVR